MPQSCTYKWCSWCLVELQCAKEIPTPSFCWCQIRVGMNSYFNELVYACCPPPSRVKSTSRHHGLTWIINFNDQHSLLLCWLQAPATSLGGVRLGPNQSKFCVVNKDCLSSLMISLSKNWLNSVLQRAWWLQSWAQHPQTFGWKSLGSSKIRSPSEVKATPAALLVEQDKGQNSEGKSVPSICMSGFLIFVSTPWC